MTDRPILFSAPMVLALLREAEEPGTGKQQTRRLAWREYPEPEVLIGKSSKGFEIVRDENTGNVICARKPTIWQRVEPGDRIWVRENFSYRHAWTVDQIGGPIWYWADGNPERGDWTKPKPSIHMPRWASRLTLIVTGKKIERLQDISEQDCEREGLIYWNIVPPGTWGVRVEGGYEHCGLTAQESFMNLWCSLHGPSAWVENPEVVVITYRVLAQNIDAMEKAA